MKYVPILGLSLRHTYYADRRCPDFGIEPSVETERLVRNHRLGLRSRPDGVKVVAAVDADGDLFIALPDRATFVFHLRLRRPTFALFTDLETIRQHAAPLYTNLGPSAAEERLSLGSHPEPAHLPSGVFATAEILYGAAQSPAGDGYREFVVDFTASGARWSYYCVTDLATEAGDPTIVDAATVEPVVFGGARNLVAEPDTADPIAAKLTQQYPDLRRLRFVSDDSVASRSEARRQLELRVNGQRVTGPLPNPKLSARSTLNVAVDGESTESASLYHVVEYPHRPFATIGG